MCKESACTAILSRVLPKVGLGTDTCGSPWPCCSILKRGPAGTARVPGSSRVLPYPQGGPRALPACSELFVPQRHTAQLPQDSRRDFHTNVQSARKLLRQAAAWGAKRGKPVWVLVDGFYGKGPSLKLARDLNIVLVSRLRKNAAFRQSNPRRGIFRPDRQRPNTTENSSPAQKTAASRALTSNFLAKCRLTPPNQKNSGGSSRTNIDLTTTVSATSQLLKDQPSPQIYPLPQRF